MIFKNYKNSIYMKTFKLIFLIICICFNNNLWGKSNFKEKKRILDDIKIILNKRMQD